MSTQQQHYRADIDGLRAIAIITVVLYHAFPVLLPGGFIGVDVFFVISGYLITGLIFNDIEAGRFAFLRFYKRRARRILPMLIVVVLASAITGYVLLYPGDYRAFASSAIAALLAWSNFFFLQHTGYFDIPSQTMPLLHTWSLGVEEQFYLVWPLAIAVGSRFIGRSRRAWIVIFAFVILASFLKALAMVGRDPKADFYLPPTRAWELALDALLVVLPARIPRPLAEALPLLGIGAIAYAAVTLSPDAPFPGLTALLPTLGAAIVILPKATGTNS